MFLFYNRSRPVVLSIGLQQLKQDMRYRVKNLSLNRPKSVLFDEPLVFNFDNHESTAQGINSDFFSKTR